MTGRVTYRSPLAILASLTNTGLFAALAVLVWVYVWSRASGADWFLVSALPILAGLLLVLPFLQRFAIAADGLRVTNLLARERIAWDEVDHVGVHVLHKELFMTFLVSGPGVFVWKTNDRIVDAYATWGLGTAARRGLAEALEAAAARHGFRNEVTAEALARRARGDTEREEAETESTGDGDDVECVFCGRVASRDEMQALDQPGPPAWHCRDADRCTAGETVPGP